MAERERSGAGLPSQRALAPDAPEGHDGSAAPERLDASAANGTSHRTDQTAALRARHISRRFVLERPAPWRPRPVLHALRDVSLDVPRGRTLGVVGESGCGKSTLARILVGLDSPSSGSVERVDVPAGPGGVQYVFQDPVAALNPRKTVGTILEAPMRHLLGLDAAQRRERIARLIRDVGLSEQWLERYPHEFSGGQAQRIGIARALAAEAGVVVLDEPVSALDVSIQAQVLALLRELQRERGLTYVFISHDLAVVESLCDTVAVMYFGSVVEYASADNLFRAPRHPYTRLLLDSVPVPGRRLAPPPAADAELPDPLAPPPGCSFAARCPRAQDRCRREAPALASCPGDARALVACFFPLTHADP